MKMKSAQLGTNTSVVEVTNISVHGLWLFIHEQEIFLPYERFPWFQDAPVRKIAHVEMPSPQHLYWPDLDVDLELDSVFHPENYPLTSKVSASSNQ
jgi:hypothetical protein